MMRYSYNKCVIVEKNVQQLRKIFTVKKCVTFTKCMTITKLCHR